MYKITIIMNIIFKLLVIFTLIILPANSAILNKIEVKGNQRVSSETIKIFSQAKINSDLDSNSLNKIIKNLYSTNFFKDVSINFKNNILYIKVEENPIIQALIFEGIKNKRILEILRDQIEMKEKSPFIEVNVKNEEKKISNILRTNGYYFSKVNTNLVRNENNTVNLIFNIELGEKAYIKKISFIGDKKIKDSKLRKIIISEEAKFWKFVSSRKYLDINRIKLDTKLLINYYKNKGYYNATIESSSAKIIDENQFELIFNINAGKKYYFGKFDLVLPADYTEKSFEKIIKVQKKLEGETYSLNKVKKVLDEIDEVALTKEYEFI